jgi:hypothetical protein
LVRLARFLALLLSLSVQRYDLVIRDGRVVDPGSSLDAIRNLGLAAGKIEAVSDPPLAGRITIDATGPGCPRAASISTPTGTPRTTASTR